MNLEKKKFFFNVSHFVYLLSAMLMAIYFRGMNFEESYQLTKSMMDV